MPALITPVVFTQTLCRQIAAPPFWVKQTAPLVDFSLRYGDRARLAVAQVDRGALNAQGGGDRLYVVRRTSHRARRIQLDGAGSDGVSTAVEECRRWSSSA